MTVSSQLLNGYTLGSRLAMLDISSSDHWTVMDLTSLELGPGCQQKKLELHTICAL